MGLPLSHTHTPPPSKVDMILLYKRKGKGLTISKEEDSHQKKKKNNNKAINKRATPPKDFFVIMNGFLQHSGGEKDYINFC